MSIRGMSKDAPSYNTWDGEKVIEEDDDLEWKQMTITLQSTMFSFLVHLMVTCQ